MERVKNKHSVQKATFLNHQNRIHSTLWWIVPTLLGQVERQTFKNKMHCKYFQFIQINMYVHYPISASIFNISVLYLRKTARSHLLKRIQKSIRNIEY